MNKWVNETVKPIAAPSFREEGNKVVFIVGKYLRAFGKKLHQLGLNLQPNGYGLEKLDRHRRIVDMASKPPVQCAKASFIAPDATVIGDVQIGDFSAVYYSSVIRGDVNKIRIGQYTTIQDRAMIHVAGRKNLPTHIGSFCNIGAGATVHAATLEDKVTVGMGALVMDGSYLEEGCFIYPNAVVSANTRVPAGQIWAGVPARYVRDLQQDEKDGLETGNGEQIVLSGLHHDYHSKSLDDRESERHIRDFHFMYNAEFRSVEYGFKMPHEDPATLYETLDEVMPHRLQLPPYYRLQRHDSPRNVSNPPARPPRPFKHLQRTAIDPVDPFDDTDAGRTNSFGV